MRKLASIQTIAALEPIPNADAIEVATILGWKVVVKKGEFTVGDRCVYCEIDSIMPKRPEFEFLSKVNYRIKTIRLRGQISQGIAFPLSVVPEAVRGGLDIGDDLTEALDVGKYEPPGDVGGEVKGAFPGYVPKTDEPRIQAVPELIAEMNGHLCYVSVKIDGTSGTWSNLDGEIDVCSRNLSLLDSEDNYFWRMYRKYGIDKILAQEGNIAIQGEVAGPKIGKNPGGLKEVQMFVFNVFDIKTHGYLDFKDMVAFCIKHGLQTVPVIRDDWVFDADSVDAMLEMAKGKYPGTSTDREGIVIRPVVETHSEVLKGRMSFKVVNNDYLLKNEEK